MKIKILCLLLTFTVFAISLAACGKASDSKKADETTDENAKVEIVDAAEVEGGHTLYVRDRSAHDSIIATFKSTVGDRVLKVRMEQLDPGDGYTEFSCHADPAVYDRVILTAGDAASEELAFNEYVDGWELNQYHYMPYLHGSELPEPQYKRVSFPYENRTKGVQIWTPDDYDANAAEKYAVIYMTDAQNLYKHDATATGSWAVAESALSCMANSDHKFIIVGMENDDGWRDDELTPNIGEATEENYKDGHGEYFADFVVDTVMPYINENYNVYTDREHTSVCGSSSGGIESFYIAMEHPDKFGSVGALSPAFGLFDDATWGDYLVEKDYSENAPFIYLYCGNSPSDSLEQSLCVGTQTMPDNLHTINYPADKVITKIYPSGLHNEMFWRAVFPDYLKYAFPKES